MKLTPAIEKFILHWGEMGTRWGVNRTQAQLHALLYLAKDPMSAEVIADTLGVARSNVSTSLRELQSWGLVQVRHLMGDRRDHFVGVQDLFEVMRLIVEGRKKREIDPTLAVMRECAEAARGQDDEEHRRIVAMLEFMTTLDETFEQLKDIPPTALLQMAKLARQMQQLAAPKPRTDGPSSR